MDRLLAIIGYTVKQHVRHKVFLLVGLFAAMLLAGGMIVSALAVEEQARMLRDLGLAGIEFLALISVVFVTVQLVLEEMETRSLYMLLTHPVPRWMYIVGRFLGTILAILAGMAAMGAMHAGSLVLFGAAPGGAYAVALLCAAGKTVVVGALALLLSLATTSTASAMTFTLFLWVLGHFSQELRFLAERSSSAPVKALAWTVRNAAPDFSFYNYHDFWLASNAPEPVWFVWLAAYTVCYAGAAILLSSWVFSRKEF